MHPVDAPVAGGAQVEPLPLTSLRLLPVGTDGASGARHGERCYADGSYTFTSSLPMQHPEPVDLQVPQQGSYFGTVSFSLLKFCPYLNS